MVEQLKFRSPNWQVEVHRQTELGADTGRHPRSDRQSPAMFAQTPVGRSLRLIFTRMKKLTAETHLDQTLLAKTTIGHTI